MTEVLHFPSPQGTNTSSSSSEPASSCAPQTSLTCAQGDRDDFVNVTGCDPEGEEEEVKQREKQDRDQLSLLALL